MKDIHEDPDVEKIFNEVKEAGETLQKAVEIVPKDWDTLSILIREREQLNKALVEKLRENCGMMTVRGERIDPFSKDKTPCVQAKMWGEHNLGLMLQRINRLLNKYDVNCLGHASVASTDDWHAELDRPYQARRHAKIRRLRVYGGPDERRDGGEQR